MMVALLALSLAAATILAARAMSSQPDPSRRAFLQGAGAVVAGLVLPREPKRRIHQVPAQVSRWGNAQPLTLDVFDEMVASFREPMGIKPDLLILPPDKYATAREVLA